VYNVTVWVVETQSLIRDGGVIDVQGMRAWAEQTKASMGQGSRPILVCDSPVSIGLARMKALPGKQLPPLSLAALAFGQTAMGSIWSSMFTHSDQICAQMLLNHEDLKVDHRKSSIGATLRTLLDMKVVPIISENESTAFAPSPLGSVHCLAEIIRQMMDTPVR